MGEFLKKLFRKEGPCCDGEKCDREKIPEQDQIPPDTIPEQDQIEPDKDSMPEDVKE